MRQENHGQWEETFIQVVVKGATRIPLHSFSVNLVFLRISFKSLKFLALLFSIPPSLPTFSLSTRLRKFAWRLRPVMFAVNSPRL